MLRFTCVIFLLHCQFVSSFDLRSRSKRDNLNVRFGNALDIPLLNAVNTLLNNSLFFGRTDLGKNYVVQGNVSPRDPRLALGEQTNIFSLFGQQKAVGGGVDQDGRIGGEWADNWNVLTSLGAGRAGQAKVNVKDGTFSFADQQGLNPIFSNKNQLDIDWGDLMQQFSNPQ